MERHLPKTYEAKVLIEHDIITPNGGKGYRETHSIHGVAFIQHEINYCRDRGWVFKVNDFEKKLGDHACSTS